MRRKGNRNAGRARRRIAYLVSRFPVTTETFIVRELDEIARRPGVSARVYSLFPAPSGARHAVALRWLPKAACSTPLRAAAGLAWCLGRHPLRTVGALAHVIMDYSRRPSLLGRALVAFAACAAHVPEIAGSADHLHAHFATYPALGAWLAHRLTGTSYSFTAHAHDIYVHQLALRRRVEEAQFVVAISDYNRRLIEDLSGSDTPMHTIHCGVDLVNYRFRPIAPPRSGPVRALCVASLEEKKGHRFLLEALASEPRLERMELHLVGSGKLREELEGQARRLGLGERVRFHGSRPENEVAGMLRRAHLFVLPSVVDRSGDMEGIPVALMEAMATGVPVVSSRLSGIPELVRDGQTGLLADPGDVGALGSALLRCLDDSDGCLERARAARRLVEREYELHANAGRLAHLLGVRERPPARARVTNPAGCSG
jgi:glycosyltransferase involved in cell wall biosynthesis